MYSMNCVASLGEVDFVDVHLLLLDQVKQEVQRPFKYFEFDFVFCHAHPGDPLDRSGVS